MRALREERAFELATNNKVSTGIFNTKNSSSRTRAIPQGASALPELRKIFAHCDEEWRSMVI